MKMHPKMNHIYVGVDTHKNSHTAFIINCFCEKLGEITIENRPVEYDKLTKEVKKHISNGITPVYGLEDTGSSGRALALYLIKKKYNVKKVDASLSTSERRNQSITHKTDSHDAFCVAKVLLSKMDELPNADPQDIYWTLSALVGRRDAIVKASMAFKNQLHTYVSSHYPSYRKFFKVFDCPTALAFWGMYPSPNKLHEVTALELGAFLRIPSSGFFGTKKAEEILELVENDGDTTTEHQGSRNFMIENVVKQIKSNNEDIKKIDNEIRNIMKNIDCKLETMVGVDYVTAAAIVSEIGDIQRFKNSDKLAMYAGIAPVKYSSGDKDRTFRNRQGNRKLYEIFMSIAARQICCGRNKDKPVNAVFYKYYQKKLEEGKTKHQAIIAVTRRLVNIIYSMMKYHREYVHPYLPN